MNGAERAEPMMEKTYIILRKYLNKVPAAAMSEIKQEWPFLFSQKCLFSHFGLLTDVDVLQKLQEAISRRGQTILDYCATLDNPKIHDVLACYDPDSDKAACILLLLMLYFKEPKESLMLEVDVRFFIQIFKMQNEWLHYQHLPCMIYYLWPMNNIYPLS